MHLLSLPYDIRHQVYQHLFPPGSQIYIAALWSHLRAITQGYRVSTEVLRSCRALNVEASEYLYNNYLFNIIGHKKDCLALYEPFLKTVHKHARNAVHVHPLSNGDHSATMCFSIHTGEARIAVLARRARGELRTIEELEREVATEAQTKIGPLSSSGRNWLTPPRCWTVAMWCCAIVVVLAAVCLAA